MLLATPALAVILQFHFGTTEKVMLGGAGACVLLLFFIIKSSFSAPVPRATLNRLQNYIDREENLSPIERLVAHGGEEDAAAARQRRTQDLLPTVSRWIANSPIRLLNGLSTDLSRIGSNWRASEILYIGLLLALVVLFVVGILLRRFVLGLFLAGVVFMIPTMLVRKSAKKWASRFETQLADTLLLMANAMSAGYGFQQAMEMVAREGQPPISEEFAKMGQEVNLGVPVNEALNNMADRVQNPDFTLAVTSIQISNEVGGELSSILHSISETIRERVRIRGEIGILTAQGKITGLMLGCLPLFMFLLLNVVVGADPETQEKYATPLFDGKTYPWGPRMVIYGVISQIIGFFVISRIINIEI